MTYDPRSASVWRAFVANPATSTEAPEVRAAWHKGRLRYAVWILRVESPEVQRRVEDVAEALAPWVTLEPDLHVTLAIAGFPRATCTHDDDVSFAALKTQAEIAKEVARAFSYQVHGASSFAAAPFLEVVDEEGHLERLRSVLDPPHRVLTIEEYRPHVTIGRWKASIATATVAPIIERFMALPPLTVAASAVELVEFDAADPHARLITTLRIPLL